jgi:biotin carboxylase
METPEETPVPSHSQPTPGGCVLFLASTRGYQTEDFKAAAARVGLELILGTDRCHMLAEVWPEGALALDFRDIDAAVATICEHARARPIRGILATDEVTAVIAERARARLGLGPETPGGLRPSEPVWAAAIAGNKLRFRQAQERARLEHPRFTEIETQREPGLERGAWLDAARRAMAARGIEYPVVVKPLHLSTSRGVMRADDDQELAARLERLRALLCDPEVVARDATAAGRIIIERYIAGREVAFEGLFDGRAGLIPLAIFDKPDPLHGPFFAETIYVAPTIEDATTAQAIARAVEDAAQAIGLAYGPVHAELRLPEGAAKPVVIEVAARAIGGLCHRSLRFAGGATLEELLLRHAAGQDIRALVSPAGTPPDDQDGHNAQGRGAHGVYMIPVPSAGVLRAIEGEDLARALPGVRDVVMTARIGDNLVPLPEGSTYMGFLFAEAGERAAVIDALRRARAAIRFRIAPKL